VKKGGSKAGSRHSGKKRRQTISILNSKKTLKKLQVICYNSYGIMVMADYKEK
jgi:hypothetical protein